MIIDYCVRYVAYLHADYKPTFLRIAQVSKEEIPEIIDVKQPKFISQHFAEEAGIDFSIVEETRFMFRLLRCQTELTLTHKIEEYKRQQLLGGKVPDNIWSHSMDEKEAKDWAQLPLWGTEQAALFSLGYNFEPSLYDDLLRFSSKPSAMFDLLSVLYVRLRNLKAAQKASQLNKEDTPINFLKHFDKMEWRVPEKLRKNIEEYSRNITRENSPKERKLGSQERETLLKLIAAMACEQYGFNPEEKRSSSIRRIRDDIEEIGETMDSKTIRKWLIEAVKFVDKDYWEKGS